MHALHACARYAQRRINPGTFRTRPDIQHPHEKLAVLAHQTGIQRGGPPPFFRPTETLSEVHSFGRPRRPTAKRPNENEGKPHKS